MTNFVQTGFALPNFFEAVEENNWKNAVTDLQAADRAAQGNTEITRRTFLLPWLAYANARSGQLKEADTLIGSTPTDCYYCLTMRGRIAEINHDQKAAAIWFGHAVQNAPEIPFAYTDWGRMLLAEGHYPEAIEKFAIANQKAPSFADPLELWGEALMGEGRFKQASIQFQYADKLAPHWQRLHLKWADALHHMQLYQLEAAWRRAAALMR